jgi:glyoxylase-like metal-dependent hydrolase (beta-lactamase superfamily II)
MASSNTIIPINGFSNSYIIKGNKAIIIDTGILNQHIKILAKLQANGIRHNEVSLIILTHGHVDHYGCLKPLKEALDVPIMVGWPDAQYVEKTDNAPIVPVNLKGSILKLFTGACKVDVVVKEDTDLREYGVDARVLTTPGHTMGSISVLTSEGDCMIGDLLGSLVFKSSVGKSPLAEAPELVGGSLKKVIDEGAKYFYPGHGKRWDAGAVRKNYH